MNEGGKFEGGTKMSEEQIRVFFENALNHRAQVLSDIMMSGVSEENYKKYLSGFDNRIFDFPNALDVILGDFDISATIIPVPGISYSHMDEQSREIKNKLDSLFEDSRSITPDSYLMDREDVVGPIDPQEDIKLHKLSQADHISEQRAYFILMQKILSRNQVISIAQMMLRNGLNKTIEALGLEAPKQYKFFLSGSEDFKDQEDDRYARAISRSSSHFAKKAPDIVGEIIDNTENGERLMRKDIEKLFEEFPNPVELLHAILGLTEEGKLPEYLESSGL